jgi:uncharacterized protein (TIGR00725 family)
MPFGVLMNNNVDGVPSKVIAVLGPRDATEAEAELAERVGALAARAGWVLLTGGGPGVMEAACRGAVEAGGITVGIIPTACPRDGYPNRWVKIPVFTGAGSSRNVYIVLTATLCVAIGGGPGTLSEIAHALKAGTPVWCWKSWTLDPPPESRRPLPLVFTESSELLQNLEAELGTA